MLIRIDSRLKTVYTTGELSIYGATLNGKYAGMEGFSLLTGGRIPVFGLVER